VSGNTERSGSLQCRGSRYLSNSFKTHHTLSKSHTITQTHYYPLALFSSFNQDLIFSWSVDIVTNDEFMKVVAELSNAPTIHIPAFLVKLLFKERAFLLLVRVFVALIYCQLVRDIIMSFEIFTSTHLYSLFCDFVVVVVVCCCCTGGSKGHSKTTFEQQLPIFLSHCQKCSEVTLVNVKWQHINMWKCSLSISFTHKHEKTWKRQRAGNLLFLSLSLLFLSLSSFYYVYLYSKNQIVKFFVSQEHGLSQKLWNLRICIQTKWILKILSLERK
jgi:hypothetical protein